MVSKVKVGKIRIEKNREFSTILACVSVKSYSLTSYKTNGHKRPPTFINREFCRILCKTHAISEILAFSICSLFWRTYAINACGSLGKIKTQKNPAIKDWIAENKKNGRGRRTRTVDFLVPNQTRYQLRYTPIKYRSCNVIQKSEKSIRQIKNYVK